MAGRLGQIHDVAEVLAQSPGAIANLAALAGGREIAAHGHANAYLQLHVLGGYSDCGEAGERLIDGPAASFFPAGSAHAMRIAPGGLATVIIEFDAQRLQRLVGERARSTGVIHWIGGALGAQAAELGRWWLARPSPPFAATTAFLAAALASKAQAQGPPRWLGGLEAELAGGAPRADRLAARLGVTRPWLGRAYRAWRGEGIAQTLRRRRVAAAAQLIERSELGLADIAAAVGFCDQSHMNRAFQHLLGRTPAALRATPLGLAPATCAPSAHG